MQQIQAFLKEEAFGVWILKNGRLFHVTDSQRMHVQIRINKDLLQELKLLSEKFNTNPSYLLENGIANMLNASFGITKKDFRNRTEFRLSIDKDLYDRLMKISEELKIKRSDLIEEAVNYIDFDNIKEEGWRYRIEKHSSG